jgi:GH15 family glucan-1,4-alpha-glucosidase
VQLCVFDPLWLVARLLSEGIAVDLYRHSIDVILNNQAPSGAYLASPAFSQYGYCWLRDGSFTAYAMDRVGQHDSAARFFRWVAATLAKHAAKAERAITALTGDLGPDDYLHTRYTVDGAEATGEWTNFQLDGYGTWLWALAEHLDLSGDRGLAFELAPAIDLSVRYLAALWDRPNFDYWEEHGDRIHVATLASIYGGLRAADKMRPGTVDLALPTAIRAYVVGHGIEGIHLVKYVGTDAVDASLVAASTPFRLLEPTDPLMVATAARIERDLAHDGGVHRYLLDTYYGGGQWTLLSAWLGWYFIEAGDPKRGQRYLEWVAAQANANGDLPEQVAGHLLAPERFAKWEERWGPVAVPLLWAHAMYIILCRELGNP